MIHSTWLFTSPLSNPPQEALEQQLAALQEEANSAKALAEAAEAKAQADQAKADEAMVRGWRGWWGRTCAYTLSCDRCLAARPSTPASDGSVAGGQQF